MLEIEISEGETTLSIQCVDTALRVLLPSATKKSTSSFRFKEISPWAMNLPVVPVDAAAVYYHRGRPKKSPGAGVDR